MSHVWDPSIRVLRRRVLVSGAIESLGKIALPTSFFVLFYVAFSMASPWPRFLAPWVGGLLALCLLVAIVVGFVTARRSEIFLAKLIDRQSGLDDRLSSAVEWVHLATPDDFQRRCIEQLTLQVGARQWALLLPSMAPKRWPLTLVALFTIAAAPIVFIRRPRPPVEQGARTIAVIQQPVAKSAQQQVDELRAEAKKVQDAELEQVSTDLGQLLHRINGGEITREDSFRQLDRIRAQVERGRPAARALAKLSANTDPGLVGALARALTKGDRTAAEAALGALVGALASQSLRDNELDELPATLQALSELARDTPSAAAGLAQKLEAAAATIRAGDQDGASKQLAVLQKDMPSLEKALTSIAAIRSTETTLQRLTRALGADAGESEEPTGTRMSNRDQDPRTAAEANPAGGTAGMASQQEGRVGSGPAAPGAGPEMAVRGTWNGKVMRQFFDSSSSSGASDEVKKLLVEHERVATNRLDRDEVPLEYQEAVRAYFAALHQKGR